MTPQFSRIFWWQVARHVRKHRLLACFNVLSIALGIAVYLAIRIANESATRAFAGGVDLVAGRAHLEIRGDMDEMCWLEVAKHPEVKAVTALVETVATLPEWPGEYLRIAGVDVFSATNFQTYQLRSAAGAHFDGERWLATRGGLAVTAQWAKERALQIGSTLRAVVDGRIETLTVLGIIEPGEMPVPDSRFAVMDIGWAQELLQRPGRISALLLQIRDPLRAEDVAESLQPFAPGLAITPPRQRSTQVEKMLAAFQLNLTALSMVSLLVGVFLIYNTVSASVARRRVQIGIVRALGLTAGEVRLLFLGEAILYAIPGILLGALGGVLLARELSGAVEMTVTSLYALVNVERLWLEPAQFVIAACFGFASAVAGAWLPASEAAAVEPVQALRRGGERREENARAARFWPWSLLALGAAALMGWLSLHSGPAWLAFGAALFILLGAAALAPAWLRVCARLPLSGLVGMAARRLPRGLRRNAITVAALASAVAMFVSLVVMVYSFRQSLDAWIGRGLTADYFIAPAANETLGLSSFLPPQAIAWLRARPEVAALDTFLEKPCTIDGRPSRLAVVDGEYRENLTFLQGDEHEAMRRAFAGEAVIVTEPFYRKTKLGLGDSLTLETPRGPLRVPIAGVYSDYSRDQGVVMMGMALHRRGWEDSRVNSVALYLHPGADGAALEREFRIAMADAGQFAMHTSRALRDRVLGIFDQTFAVTQILRTIAIVVAVAGVFLSMTTLVTERRRELALLRALGATPNWVGGLVLSEAALLGFAASLLGVAAGVPLAMVLTWVVNPAFFGWTIHLSIPAAALVATPLWIVPVAVTAAWWPAWMARSIEIPEALHTE